MAEGDIEQVKTLYRHWPRKPWTGGIMRHSREMLILMVLITSAHVACAADEWPPKWSPEDALSVPLTTFEMHGVSLLTALSVLDNECGLVFGFCGSGPWRDSPPYINVNMQGCIVSEVVEELDRQAFDYSLQVVDGVVVATPDAPSPGLSTFLDQRVGRFEAEDLPPADLKAEVRRALDELDALPPVMSMDRGDADTPLTTLRLDDEPLPLLLTRSAAAICQSWIYIDLPEMERASFAMGRGWGLPMGTTYTLHLAPEAPREPIPGALPPPDVVRERVEAALLEARRQHYGTQATVTELTALVDERWNRTNAFTQVMHVIELLGEIRDAQATEVLARNIDFSSAGDALRRKWMAARREGAAQADVARAFADWLNAHPALRALDSIGRPAVPTTIDVLATHHVEPLRHSLTGSTLPDEREGKTILLCEALRRILGDDTAIARLQASAEAERDEERARGLFEAAQRVRQGLSAPAQ